MKIERRKLSYSQQRNQVVTTLNADFLREIGIEPDSHVNIMYEDTHRVILIFPEENLDHVLDIENIVKDSTCPTCGSVSVDKNCKKCDKAY